MTSCPARAIFARRVRVADLFESLDEQGRLDLARVLASFHVAHRRAGETPDEYAARYLAFPRAERERFQALCEPCSPPTETT